MPNGTAFGIAHSTMEWMDWYSASSDAEVIMCTISGRVGANQTETFSQMVKTCLQWQHTGTSSPLMDNLMTVAQDGPELRCYINELFVQSNEDFVRVYPSHFSDTGVMSGPAHGSAVLPPATDFGLGKRDGGGIGRCGRMLANLRRSPMAR